MAVIAADTQAERWLLCRAGSRLCALPLEHVAETMRALPIEPLERAPSFVLGLCILRGAPVPVVDAAALVGEQTDQRGRFVAIRTGHRLIALALGEVLGVRSIAMTAGMAAPPLLREAAGAVVSAISTLDAELLLVLDAVRILPDAAFAPVGAQGVDP